MSDKRRPIRWLLSGERLTACRPGGGESQAFTRCDTGLAETSV